MHDAISDLFLRIDLAIAESAGVVADEELRALLDMRTVIESRLAQPDDVLLVAIAGGTGSGKSSLVNALAGEELVETGGIRPTTLAPLAVAASSTAGALAQSLTSSGVGIAVAERLPPWLVLIDLPDTDSVAVSHGKVADSVLARVDVVIWVVDPEKYGDASLHHSYLRRWSDYQSQHVYVLNQMDRLPPDSRSEVAADFVRVLGESGVEVPVVVSTIAATVGSPPEGVDRLWEVIPGISFWTVFFMLVLCLRILVRAMKERI